MLALSALVFLPDWLILVLGTLVVFGHNSLDSINRTGSSVQDILWYALHQPHSVLIESSHLINFVYPVLPWIGLMALGYVLGGLYRNEFDAGRRQRWLLMIGVSATVLFLLLRGFNLYGEPHHWQTHNSFAFSLMSFLNTTKYPPSLHFLLMTMGPALILLSVIEPLENRLPQPIIVFGRVPFFFYVVHLYVIHGLATLLLVYQGRDWHQYILSAKAIMSGALRNFGLSLGGVYVIWILVILLLYPLCKWYQTYRQHRPSSRWLSYL